MPLQRKIGFFFFLDDGSEPSAPLLSPPGPGNAGVDFRSYSYMKTKIGCGGPATKAYATASGNAIILAAIASETDEASRQKFDGRLY